MLESFWSELSNSRQRVFEGHAAAEAGTPQGGQLRDFLSHGPRHAAHFLCMHPNLLLRIRIMSSLDLFEIINCNDNASPLAKHCPSREAADLHSDVICESMHESNFATETRSYRLESIGASCSTACTGRLASRHVARMLGALICITLNSRSVLCGVPLWRPPELAERRAAR